MSGGEINFLEESIDVNRSNFERILSCMVQVIFTCCVFDIDVCRVCLWVFFNHNKKTKAISGQMESRVSLFSPNL